MNIEYLQDWRNCAGRYVLAEHLTRGWFLPQRLQEWAKRQFWWLHLPKLKLRQTNLPVLLRVSSPDGVP